MRWIRPPSTYASRSSVGQVPQAQGRGEDAHAAHLRGNIPTFIRITDGKVHDVNILDELLIEAGAFLWDGSRLHRFRGLHAFTLELAFFVVRTKENVLIQRRYSHRWTKAPAYARIRRWSWPPLLVHGVS